MSKASNKMKLPLREPLKVKLPKLKRSHMQSTKEKPFKSGLSEVKIAKIKLPSFSAKKKNKNLISPVPSMELDKESTRVSDSTMDSNLSPSKKVSPVKLKVKLPFPKTVNTSPKQHQSKQNSLPQDKASKHGTSRDISLLAPPPPPTPQLDRSTHSTASSTTNNDSSTANTSFNSSEDDNGSQKMEIMVISQNKQEDSGIKCVCGVDDDIGVMVECEKCSTWQHGHCINVGTEDDAYEGYICANCTYPPGEARKSLYQLTVSDKYSNKFEAIQSLRERFGSDLEKITEATENGFFTRQELANATNQLKRVLNSLTAKWRLLTAVQYDSELRIWSHPHWSPDEEENRSNLPDNLYFVDRMKVNLKLNIRYMLREMERRCDLIQLALLIFAIQTIKTRSSEPLSVESIVMDPKFREVNMDLRQEIQQISESVRKYRERFDNLPKQP